MPRGRRRKIEVPTDTQPQFELGDTAEDIERRGERRERREQEERGRERIERGGKRARKGERRERELTQIPM